MHQPPIIVITGASAGVGRATARLFASRGATIGLLARGEDGLNATLREVESLGGRGVAIPTDVAEAKQVDDAAAIVEQQFGPIDIWINNAMVSVFSPALQMTAEEFKRVTDVTYLGYVYGTLAALRYMVPRDRGLVVQVGSALAYRGIPLQSAYCGAKHAIQGFTESVRAELMHENSQVKLTMVQMPALNTPQFSWVKSRLPRKPQPVPPILQPELAAQAIEYATRHYRREWNLGWSTAIAITGDKFLPGLGDWYLAKQGFDSQQYNGQVPKDRKDNLFAPVPGDHGAHGDFDDRATSSAPPLWLTQNWELLVAAGAFVGGCLLGLGGRGRSHTQPRLRDEVR